MMQLSRRLSAVADMVTDGNRLADVGCDHGYLPLYLYMNHKIPSAIAMDVRPGPLSRAKEHISQYGLENYIETRLSDGLNALSPGEGDTLTIAGMGGPLMERILSAKPEVRESFLEMILQPQSDIPHFRRFLREIGWKTVEETIIFEDGKFYPMMRVIKGEPEKIRWEAPYTMEEAFGEILLKEKNPILKLYLERELRIRNDILEKLKMSGTSAEKRLKEVEEERILIENALKIYESL